MTRRAAAWRDRRGTVALEFAIVGSALLLVILGIIEFALQSAVGALVESAGREASRFGITGALVPQRIGGSPPESREEAIRRIVLERGAGFLKADRLTIRLEAFDSMAAAAEPGSGTRGAGEAGQVVIYELNYKQPLLVDAFIPILKIGELLHHTTVIVKNEPSPTL
ncbi:TadE family protein [Marinimicrococcus flavescens]|uniref:Pilus assembly protein n=1 Tax=Marinimicrococcus flavescens TaxID=3031815 RepID=A0AAP3UX95_9PROT|nr:pilus assembly protein [Marinimicrococcus flavescens]